MNNKKKLITAGIILASASATIYAINKIIDTAAVTHELLRSRAQKFYHWRFGKIHYTVQGSGSPILLIHDLTPYSSNIEWKNLISGLEKNHTVYTIDLLGCGCSDRPKITYTNYLYVQLITDFIKNIIQEKTDIITNGFSGSFAIMAAKNEESIINRILMINPEDLPNLNKVPSKRSKIVKQLLELPLIGSLLYNIITNRDNMDLLFTEKYLFNPFHFDVSLVDAYYECAHLDHGNGRYLLSSLQGNYVNIDITKALKSINNSIFILEGSGEKRSEEIPVLYTYINSSIEAEQISSTKHFPHLEAPEKVLEYLSIFFSE